MQTKKVLIGLLFSVLCLISLPSQAQIDEAVNILMGAELIDEYRNHKEKAEEVVRIVKASGASENDIAIAKTKYGVARDHFNDWVDMVVEDLLDKQTRKLIIKQPEFVSWKYKGKMDESAEKLNEFYAYSSFAGISTLGIGEIMVAIEVVREMITLYKEIKSAIKASNREQVVNMFKEPLEFKAWEDIN